jgi:glycerophosphoryl diester phosphodiesterase
VSENTFPAFDKALRSGCDGFEFDVRLSSDGRGVVCHDPVLHGLEIARSSFSVLLAARAKSNARSSQGAPELPCLEDVLAKYSERAFLDIELKTAGLEEITLKLLAQLPRTHGVVVSSFLPQVLETLADLAPNAPLGLIFATRLAMRSWERLPISHVMPRHELLDRTLMDEFHAAGKQVLAWTVNRERRMRILADMGVDGLISDSPELLVRFRQSLITPGSAASLL